MFRKKISNWLSSIFRRDQLHSSPRKKPKLIPVGLNVENLEPRLTPANRVALSITDLGFEQSFDSNQFLLVGEKADHPENFSSLSHSLDFSQTMGLEAEFQATLRNMASTHGVIFVDSNLVNQVPEEELQGSLVFVIDGSRDVAGQITTALQGLENIPVLRIISHGSDGALWFGNQSFDSTDLTSSAMQVASWGKSLNEDADILLYGCSVASTDAGKEFVQQFASITQADIAASIDTTGVGGDVDLEYSSGVINHYLTACSADYESKGISLDTSNESIDNFWNNQDGTGTIDIKYDVDGLNGSQTLYLFRNGTLVASKSGISNATGRVFRYTGVFGVGNNVFRLSPYSNDPTWSTSGYVNKTITAVAISGPTSVASKVFSSLNGGAGVNYDAPNATLDRVWSATNLPTGLSINSTNGFVTGTPVLAGAYNSTIFVNNGFSSDSLGVTFNISKITPTINFLTPNSISYGTPISGAQLNASSSNNGGLSISYNYSLGTILAPGNYTLTATSPSDSNYNSVSASVNLVVINNLPVANPQSILVKGDVSHTGKLAGSDADGNSLSYSLVNQGTRGVVTLTNPATGEFTYVPNQNENGTDSFSFRVHDGVSYSSPATVTVNSQYIPPLNFKPQTSFATWNKGGKVITADVNNDGKQDIVVQNIGYAEPNSGPRYDYVSVFLGKGDGTFEGRTDTATGSYSNWLGSGDFNGDGKVDFVTPNYCGESITILLGRGDGSFNRQDISNAGGTTSPSFVTTGDVNGDGKIDILTTNQNSSNVSVFLGRGDGSFQAPNLLSTSAIPNRIVLGDFNSDGKMDLVVHTSPGSVPTNTLFLGTGTGSFTANSNIAIAGELAVGDFNSDGKQDLAGTDGNSVKVLLGNGNATFKSALAFSANGVGASIIATDINGDGALDLQLTQFNNNTVAVLMGNGDGAFKSPVTFGVGSGPFTVASADFNNDGKRDLVVSNFNSNNVSVLLNTENTAPTLSPSRIVVQPTSASIGVNSEVSFSETQAIPAGATVYGVKVTRDLSTYWPSSNPAIAYVYLKLNGVAVGQLGFVASGTNGAYTSVSTEFFGPLSSYIPGGVNTWTIGSAWNPVNLANIKIQVFYSDASTPAIAVNGIEDTPLNFTAANFTNAYGDSENNPLASITIASVPATGTLKLLNNSVSVGQVISAPNLGNLTYVPAPNENGIKTFTITASDGYSSSAVATVSMNIAAVSDAPVIGGMEAVVNYISTDFTTAPANAVVSGTAVVANGECVLTPASSGANGYLLFNSQASNPTAFSAQFDYRVADGNGADGTSFNYGVINGLGNLFENGITNTGLVVSFIEFGTQRVEVRFNGALLQTAYVTLIGSNYQQFIINVDGSNRLSVSVGGVAVVNNLDLGATYGSADKSGWQFGFASRCGGLNNKHSIDNLVISNNVAPVTALEQTPSVLAGSLTLSDVDNSTLASAVVTITSGLKTSEDVLSFVANPAIYGNITSAYNSATGALTLTSAGATATLAQWQAALRSVTYINTSDTPDTTSRTVSFVVNDGTVNSAAATVTVNVTAVNDAPVANADTYTTTEDTPLVVSLGSPVVDQQQTTWNTGLPYNGYQTFTAGQTGFLTSIDLMQNGGASNPQQVTLTVYAGDGIGGVALGEVTISETNSYNSTLNGYIQTYTLSQPVAIFSGGVYTFKVLSTSNRGLVGSSNTNAYANGRFYHSGGHTGDLWFRTSVTTGQGLLLNDSDAEGNSLTAVVVANPSNGSVVINSDGKFTYTPNANFNGTDTFTYKASDGISFSNIATVTMNVTAVNDAPTANAQTIAATEDTTYSGTLNGSDTEGGALTYSVVTQGGKGIVTITNAATGAFTYVPNANANGSDSFTFKVNDGSLDSPAVTVTVNITPLNDAPVANGSATLAAVNEDIGTDAPGATVANLFGGSFSDSQDNPSNTFAGIAVSSYTVDVGKGNWQYSPNGSTWLNLASATSSAAITLKATDYLRFVPAANYNGQATALSANLIETGGAVITSGATVNLSGTGPQLLLGSGNVIGWSSVYSDSFAADNVVDEQSGSIVPDVFGNNYWLASDGSGSASILIDLGVATPLSKIDLYNTTNTGYNDRGTSSFHMEVANAITGSSASTYSLVNGLTVANGTLAYETPSVTPTAQTFALSSGATAYRYVRFVVDTSKNNNPGLHELRLFGVGNGVGGTTVYSQQAVSINHVINPVNDLPSVSASQPSVTLLDYQYTRNWGVSESFVTITKSDPDGVVQYDELFFANNGWTSSDNGVTVTKNLTYGYARLRPSTNVLTYYLDQGINLTNRLRQGQTVTETIPVQVTDGQLTALTNVVFTIDGQNDEPELYRVNNLVGASEDSEYEISYSSLTNNSQLADIDGGVTAFVVKNVTSGVLKIGANAQSAILWNASNNSVISTGLNGYWTPALNANGLLAAFTVVVKDDGGLESLNPLQVNIQVAQVNDAPVANAQTITPTEDTTYTGILTGSDVEGSPLTYSVVAQGSKGVVTITNAATGAFTYVPNANANGADSFTFKVNDGSLDSAVVSVTVDITPVNDAPVVTASHPSVTLLDYQYTRNWGVSESFVTITKVDPDGVVQYDELYFANNGWTSPDNGVTVTKNLTYGYVSLRPSTNVLTYYLDQQRNLTSRLRPVDTVTETIPIQITDGQLTALTNVVFTIDGQNDEPELYRVNNLVGASEDSEYEISYSSLTNNSQLADIDGGVTAFVVKNVTSGVLKIGANAQSAIPWNAANNAVITNGLNAYWTPALNANGLLAAFTVVVKDDGGLESLNPLQVNVQVAAVNDRPVVTAGSTLSYTENAGAIVIDAGIVIADVDDTQISGATVKIEQIVSGDVLGFTNQNGITGVFNGQTGILTLSGTATVAQYQQALRSVTYSSTSEDPTLNNTRNNRTITWVVSDVNSSNANNGILTSDNGAGVSASYLTGSAYTLNADGSNPYTISMDLGQNWSFEAEYRMNSSNGLNTLFSYGNYTDGVLIRTLRSDSVYVKGFDFNQIDVFGTSNTNGVFVPVKITYTNTGNTATLSVYAAGSLVKSVTTTSSLNPADKTIRIGSAHHSNGEGFDGAVRNIKVSVGIGSGITSLVNVIAVNDVPTLQTPAPITITDTSATDVFGAISSSLVATDVDANRPLVYSITGVNEFGGIATKVGNYGILVLNTATGAYTFTPNNAAINALSANASETFVFGVSDGLATTNASLVVNLISANDTPTLQNPALITITDTPAADVFGVIKGSLVAADVDANTTLAYSITGVNAVAGFATAVGTYGTLILNTTTGAYTFTPNNVVINALTANTSEIFTFGVSDSIVTTQAPLEIRLVASNDTPIVLNIDPVLYKNTNAADVFENATGTVSASDADANAILVYGIAGQGVVINNGNATLAGQYGILSIEVATGKYSYAPNQNQLDSLSGDASDHFALTISDGTATVNKPFVVNIHDKENPSVSINSDVKKLKSGEVANISFNFSEVPTGFSLSSLNVTGGTLSDLVGSGTNYTAKFSPTANSNIAGTVGFKPNSYTDPSGNFGLVAALATPISIDTLPPLPPIVGLVNDTGINNNDNITSAGIVVVSGIENNAKWEYSNDGGVNWNPGIVNTFAFKNDGAKTLFVRQTDAAGNLGAVNEFGFVLDTVEPSVPSIGLEADTGVSVLDKITNKGKILVSGLETNASFEYSFDAGKTWTFVATGNSFSVNNDGAKLVRVRQVDLAGNKGAATSDLQFTLDTVLPSVSMSTSTFKLKAGETANITLDFSETPFNFDYADFTTVEGGTLSKLTQNLLNKKQFTALYTPFADSTTTGKIVVGSNFTDAAGNMGRQSITVDNILIDTTLPTVEISSDSSSLKIGETALITFNLGEASADFDFADVSVAGGTLSNFAGVTSGNGLVYTAVFTPSANSSATAFIKVDAGKFADSFGNQNQPSNVLKIAVDTSAPVANFAKIATPRNTAVNSLELGFTELVQGLDVSDLSLNFNGNLVSLAGVGISGSGSNYTISGLNTSAQGSYLFSLNSAGSGISDLAGNSLVANAQVSWIVDTSSPAVAITSSTSNLNPGQTAVITFNFSTAPTGFDALDISAVGGNITGLTKSSNTVYTATFTPAVNFSGKGSVSVSNGYTNAAGTTGLPGLSEPISIDTLAPTALISADSQKLAAGQTSTITITFSETVTGFDSTDLAVEGGTIGALVQSRANPLVYTTVFAPNSNFTGKGKILLQGSYEDVSGNSGTVASLLPELLVDTMPARVDFITRGKPSSPDTNASAVAFNVRFNEIVAGVDASDFELVLSNGLTVASPLFVAGKGDSYSVDVSGISKTDGVLGIRLKNDATILDAFGNALVNTTTLNENQTYTIDNTAPTVVSINSDKYRLGSTTKANITITFSEAPKGFDAFDVGATGGTLSNLAATSDPRVYTATFTPTAGTTTSNARVTVYQGYSDVAGNPGSEFVMTTPMAIVGVPVGKIVPLNPPAEVAPEGSIVLKVNFTEDVNELEIADFTTTGVVTLSNLQRVTGGNKSFTVLATAGASEGDFSVGLRVNATEDIGLPENKTALVSPITIRVDASSGFDSAKVVEANQGSKTTFGGFADIANDADFFKFTAAFTGSVSTLVKADASKFDPFATAYVQEGSNYKLLISDDNSGGGTSSKMDFNVTAGKTYFIKVESPAKTTGKYALEITGGEKLADDFGDSQADASVLSVSSRPVTTNGTLENNQDSDSFKFTPTQNGKVDISFAATTLTSGKLNIFSTTSTTPLASLDFNGSNSFDVLAGKTYYLLVSSEAGGTGDYSFTISSQAALQFVNGVAKATNFIPVAGNADVYSLSAPSSGLLSILVENRDRNLGLLSQPSFAVYNSNGNLLTANVFSTLGPIGASKQIVNLNATVGETYFVKVGEVGTFTGNYNITVQSDDVASLARTSNGMPMYSSVPLPAGGTTGKIELAGDTDLYSYSYSNSTGNLSKLQILMSPASGSALVSGMFVSQDNGISWNAASQKGSLVELDVEAGETKSLLIWASGSSGSTGSYILGTRVVTDDIGNTRTTAANVLLDAGNISNTNAFMNYSGDVDVFKVTLNTSGTTLFSVESSDDAKFDPKLTITSLSGQVIASDEDSGKGLGSLIVLDGTVGDSFFLTVSGSLQDANRVGYTLKTGELPVDDAANKPDTSATSLLFNSPVVVNGKSTQSATEAKAIKATMPGVADFDVFQFISNDTGRFEITVTPGASSALAPNLQVFASDGKTVLASSSAIAGKATFALPFITKGEKVYVSINGANGTEGDYTLKVETPVSVVDFFANAYNDTATGLPVGVLTLSGTDNSAILTGQNLNIEASRDVDAFTFTAVQSGPVKLLAYKVVGSSLDTSVSVYDANGKMIASNNDADRSTTDSATVFEVTAGKVYYVQVTGDSGSTGKYGITLQDLTPSDSDGFGNNIANAVVLTLDSNLETRSEADIVSAGDRDLFKITVESDGILNFGLNAINSSGLDGHLYIYDSNFELIAEDDDSGEGLNSFTAVYANAGETFYIQTSGDEVSTGAYRVWARLEIDDHSNLIGAYATELDVDENFAVEFGTISTTTDDDVFAFTATNSGTIDVYLGAEDGSELDTYLFAYDSTGQILIDYNNNISSTDTDSYLSIQVVEGQKYFLKVSGSKGTTGDYFIVVMPVADDVGSTIADASNLSLAVSSSTPANTLVGSATGSIETKGDADFYKVSVTQSGRYEIRVASASNNGIEDTTLEVYSVDGRLLARNDDESSSSSNSALDLNLAEGDVIYVRAAGYGENTGDYQVDISYLGAVVTDDFGDTIDQAYAFLLDDSSSYSLTGAGIQFSGDVDTLGGVADITGNISITLNAGSAFQGSVKAFVSRGGEIIQVASSSAQNAGGEVTIGFAVSASDEFYVQVAGVNGSQGSYDLQIDNVQSSGNSGSPRPVDSSVIDNTANELSDQFAKLVADAEEGADINEISQSITEKLVATFIASMGGTLDQDYIIIWLDPVDFSFGGSGGAVGSSGGSSVIENSAASLSSKGALDMVVVSGAQASQYNLQLTGVGSGQVLAGATMVTASGQVINPTVSGGASSTGIASGSVPKSGMQLVLDFTPQSNGGGNNGGGGNNNGGGNGGNNGGIGNGSNSGDSSSVSEGGSSSSGSSSGGGRSGGNSSLLNALSRAGNSISSVFEGAAEGLAGLALGGGGSATGGADEGALASEFVPGGNGTGNDLLVENKNENAPGSVSAAVKLAQVGVFVITTVSESYSETMDAVQTSITTEQATLKQIASIVDKAIPDVVPSEFEQALEKSFEKTTDLVLKEAKESVAKVGDLLTDLVTARINQKPAKADASAVHPATQIAEANGEMVDQEFVAMAQSGLAIDFEFASDPLENHADLITGNQLGDSDFYFETSEWVGLADRKSADEELLRGVGILAGVMLAPGVLSPALDHPVESEKSAKRKKPIRLKD